MDTNKLDIKNQMEIITEMIHISKNKIIDDGSHFILWGILIAVCSFIQFFMIQFLGKLEESNIVWLIMPIIGVPISIYMGRKSVNNAQVKTIITDIYTHLWMGFGVGLGFIIFISIHYYHSPTAYILVFMGFAVYLSYIILNYKPLLIGSIIFFISSIIYIYIDNAAYQALLYGTSVILGYIIPGCLLFSHKKDSSHA